MKDLGPLHRFLGLSITHHADRFLITQRQFILEILERAGIWLILSYLRWTACQFLTRLTTVVSLVPCSTSPSLGQILLMRFSRLVFTCITRVSLIKHLSSTFCSTFMALSTLVFISIGLISPLWLYTLMLIGLAVQTLIARHLSTEVFLGTIWSPGHPSAR